MSTEEPTPAAPQTELALLANALLRLVAPGQLIVQLGSVPAPDGTPLAVLKVQSGGRVIDCKVKEAEIRDNVNPQHAATSFLVQSLIQAATLFDGAAAKAKDAIVVAREADVPPPPTNRLRRLS